MNCVARRRMMRAAVVCALVTLAGTPSVQAEDCSNQALIATCLFGCEVTEATCGALCGAATVVCEGVCEGVYATCDFGCDVCDVACDACCPYEVCIEICDPLGIFGCYDDCYDTPNLCIGGCSSCKSGCSSCHNSCSSTRSSCKGGCQADCDDCLFCTGACPACIPFKKIGESCLPLDIGVFAERCATGLSCWPVLFPEESAFQCFPNDTDELLHDDACRAFYSPGLHQGAIDIGNALSFGAGSGVAAIAGASIESGTVYGPDGSFGCYLTECVGAETNAGISVYAAVGLTLSFDDFKGESLVIVETVGEVLNFSTSQILNLDGDLIGTADSLSLGVSVLPITAGFYSCNTIVDTVGILDGSGTLVPVVNNAPAALCADVATCAGAVTCVSGA